MRVTKEVADVLNGTFAAAAKGRYEYVTPELLLAIIAKRPTFCRRSPIVVVIRNN